MGLTSLVTTVSAFFAAHEVPAFAVYGERKRPATGLGKAGLVGGRVSFLLTGKGKYQGSTWLGPREGGATLSKPGLLVLINDVREQRLAHYATAGAVHLAAQAPATPGPATNLIEGIDLVNVLRTNELAHQASLAAHTAADTAHAITAPAASSAATARVLALQLQAQGNAHDATTADVHGEADDEHDSTAADPLSATSKTKAIAQAVVEVSAEVWAWNDAAPRDDATQYEAWLSLHEWTLNALRKYGRGVHLLDRLEPATDVLEIRRGMALVTFFTLPIPVLELPATKPVVVSAELTTSMTLPQGQDPAGEPIDPVSLPALSGTIPTP